MNRERQGRQEMWGSFLCLPRPSFLFSLVSPLVYLFGSLLLLPLLLTDAGSAFFSLSLLFSIRFSIAFFSLRLQEFGALRCARVKFIFALSLFHMQPEVHLVAVWGFRK